MPIGDVYEGWCPCGTTHVKRTLVDSYEQKIPKGEPLPASDEPPYCKFCGEDIELTFVGTQREGTA
jgi:hypothetical protein